MDTHGSYKEHAKSTDTHAFPTHLRMHNDVLARS